MNLKRIVLAAVIAATASGCSWFGTKNAEYKGAKARTVQPLEVPPELTTPTIDDRFAVPDPKAQTTYSAYTQRNTPGAGPLPTGANAATVLPKVESARLERVGDQRWLIVQGEPAAVWRMFVAYPALRWWHALGRLRRGRADWVARYLALTPVVWAGLWATAAGAWREWRRTR